MPIDFTKPTTTRNYATEFVPDIVNAFTALSQWLDPTAPGIGTVANPPSGAYRVNAGAVEKFDGTSWAPTTLNGVSTSGGLATMPGAIVTAMLQVATNAQAGIEVGRIDGIASTPYIDFHSGAVVTDYDVRLIASGGNGAPGQGILDIFASQMRINGVGVWTASNLAAASIMYNRGEVAGASIDSAVSNGFHRVALSGYSDGMLVFDSEGSVGPLQMKFTYQGDMHYRNKTDNSAWTAWKHVLTNVNQAIYSGVSASGSVVSVAGGAKLFLNGFAGSLAATVGQNVEIRNNGGTGTNAMALVSFHCSGFYASHLGLTHDGFFGVGGWSRSSWAWNVHVPTGNMTAIGSITAGGNLACTGSLLATNFIDTDQHVQVGTYVTANGNMWAANFIASSDDRLKQNWRALPVDFVERLARVKHGVYDRTDIDDVQVGVSAQSLREALPEAVKSGPGSDDLAVSYGHAALAGVIALANRLLDVERRMGAA